MKFCVISAIIREQGKGVISMNNLKDRVTIYQVAQAAGVSLATVSRVINKQGNVTESTRTKVEATI